jgi:hypothetical protein
MGGTPARRLQSRANSKPSQYDPSQTISPIALRHGTHGRDIDRPRHTTGLDQKSKERAKWKVGSARHIDGDLLEVGEDGVWSEELAVRPKTMSPEHPYWQILEREVGQCW